MIGRGGGFKYAETCETCDETCGDRRRALPGSLAETTEEADDFDAFDSLNGFDVLSLPRTVKPPKPNPGCVFRLPRRLE
jgi:hypothetical protein